MTTDDEIDPKDDPHDDITDRLGDLPKADTDSTKRSDKRDTRGQTIRRSAQGITSGKERESLT